MKNKSNHIELVQKYLNNELNAQELDAFEKELKQNDLLEAELNLHKKIDAFIQDDELENFKNELDIVYDNLVKKDPKRRQLNIRQLSLIAASVIILLTAGVVFMNGGSNQLSCDEIFDEYYEGYPSSYTTRSLTACPHDSLYSVAINQYKSKEFEEAKLSLTHVIKAHPDNVASKFYLGVVLVELGAYSNAIEYFNMVIETNDPYYQEQSEWYKVLSTIKMEKKSDAITQLHSIVKQNGFYHDQAEEILSKVE